MNLSFLKDHELHLATQNLVQKERELLTTILHHLAEIEKRRLYCDYSCSSLFEYCVKILGYSESQAQRRISAMRLIREIPEVEKKIENGSLTLTNASEAQRFFRQEQKLAHKSFSIEEKKQILSQLENKSTREGERELLSMSSQPLLVQEKTRAVTPNITELKIMVDQKLMKKLEKAKGLLAHKNIGSGYADLLNALCDVTIWALEPKPPTEKDIQKTSSLKSNPSTMSNAKFAEKKPVLPSEDLNDKTTSLAAPVYFNNSVSHKAQIKTNAGQTIVNHKNRKAIPISIKRIVWHRDQGRCCNCGSQHRLEYDHIKPVALGGENDPSNLRLLCSHCNERAAIHQFGLTKMSSFLQGRAIN